MRIVAILAVVIGAVVVPTRIPKAYGQVRSISTSQLVQMIGVNDTCVTPTARTRTRQMSCRP